MKFEIVMAGGAATESQERRGHPNGDFVGTAEWQGPGQVALDMTNEEEKEFFESYFTRPMSHLAPAGNHEGMTYERPCDSEAAFNRAMYELAAYAYKVHSGDGRRKEART